MSETLNAIVADEVDGRSKGGLTTVRRDALPDYDVLVDVAHSTLNYKDGLAVTGKGKIARKFPMVLGIDLAGTVAESKDPTWNPGDPVVVNGFGLSETEWGGYIEQQRLKPAWLVRLPDAFTTAQAMAIGTAGYTAMLAVLALEHMGVVPGEREILVTGAAGGVGSVAVALLAKLGHQVVAATGRPDTHDYLTALGAAGFIDRAALSEKSPPMQRERWGGVVDAVGGQTLATAIAQTCRHGAVASIGLAGGADLPGSVFPFILRGVTLLGIDSVYAPPDRRRLAWQRLATDLAPDKLALITAGTEPMSKVPELAPQILEGKIRGRMVIDVRG